MVEAPISGSRRRLEGANIMTGRTLPLLAAICLIVTFIKLRVDRVLGGTSAPDPPSLSLTIYKSSHTRDT